MYAELDTAELPDNAFFHDDEYPKTKAEYDTFVGRLEHYARAAKPFIGVSQTLRPLTDGMDRTVLGSPLLTDAAAINITLEHPLQTGEDKWSQVWRAKLSISGLTAPVAVKIFQQSMFFSSESFTETGIDEGCWPTGAQQARAEAWAYRTLAQLQGKTIPWSYGFFKLALPNGENAFAHVMEYIDRPSAEDITLANASNDLQDTQFADSMASSYYEILQRGVQQSDVAPRNMLVDRTDVNPIVFIDFSAVKPTPNLLVKSDGHLIVIALNYMGFRGSRLGSWFEDRKARGLPWMRIFEVADRGIPDGWNISCVIISTI